MQVRTIARATGAKLWCLYPNPKTWRWSKKYLVGSRKFKTPQSFNLQSVKQKVTIVVTLLCHQQKGISCQNLKLCPQKLLSCKLWWHA